MAFFFHIDDVINEKKQSKKKIKALKKEKTPQGVIFKNMTKEKKIKKERNTTEKLLKEWWKYLMNQDS